MGVLALFLDTAFLTCSLFGKTGTEFNWEAGSFLRTPLASWRGATELIVKPCPLAAQMCCTFSTTSFSSIQTSAFGFDFIGFFLDLMFKVQTSTRTQSSDASKLQEKKRGFSV